MTYVLVRTDGAYVAAPGSDKSYTRKLENARTWPTREAAQQDACGNEAAREVSTLLRR